MSDIRGESLGKLKSTGLMKQKAGDLFSVRLKMVGGYVTADQLRALAAAAEVHGSGHVHLTTRQGVEIPGVPYREIDGLRDTLAGAELRFGTCGPRVRTITACQGDLCSHGLIDSQAVARALDQRATQENVLPHKFKIGITGCPNACIKPQENDLGVMGQTYVSRDLEACSDCGLCADACRTEAFRLDDDGQVVEDLSRCCCCGACVDSCPTGALRREGSGYAVFVGGKMGNQPRLADRLPFHVTTLDTLLDVIRTTLQWYADYGSTKERFGATIDRVGLGELTGHLFRAHREVVHELNA